MTTLRVAILRLQQLLGEVEVGVGVVALADLLDRQPEDLGVEPFAPSNVACYRHAADCMDAAKRLVRRPLPFPPVSVANPRRFSTRFCSGTLTAMSAMGREEAKSLARKLKQELTQDGRAREAEAIATLLGDTEDVYLRLRKRYYTPSEVADRVGVSRQTVDQVDRARRARGRVDPRRPPPDPCFGVPVRAPLGPSRRQAGPRPSLTTARHSAQQSTLVRRSCIGARLPRWARRPTSLSRRGGMTPPPRSPASSGSCDVERGRHRSRTRSSRPKSPCSAEPSPRQPHQLPRDTCDRTPYPPIVEVEMRRPDRLR